MITGHHTHRLLRCIAMLLLVAFAVFTAPTPQLDVRIIGSEPRTFSHEVDYIVKSVTRSHSDATPRLLLAAFALFLFQLQNLPPLLVFTRCLAFLRTALIPIIHRALTKKILQPLKRTSLFALTLLGFFQRCLYNPFPPLYVLIPVIVGSRKRLGIIGTKEE